MKRLWTLLLAVILLLSFSLTAFAEDWTTKDITLTFLHGHTDDGVAKVITSKGFRAMVDKFLAEHPNVKIEEERSSEQGTLMLQQMAADNLTDIVCFGYSTLRSLVEAEQLADITDLVDTSEYADNCVSCSMDGHVYGLPMKQTEYNYVYYNENLLHEAGLEEFPKTLEEFLALDKYFDEKGIDLIALGNNVAWWTPTTFLTALVYEILGPEKAYSLITSDGTVKWTDPEVAEALNWLPKIAATCNVDFNSRDDIWAAGWYAQGKAFCYPGGSWVGNTIKTFAEDYPEVVNATRCAIFPSISGEKDKTFLSGAGAESYGISAKLKRGTPEFDAAFALISQIASKDYADMMVSNGTISAHLTDLEPDVTQFPPMIQDFLAVHNAGYQVGASMHIFLDVSVLNVLEAMLPPFMAGETTVEDVTAKVEEAAESLREDLAE